MSENDTLHARAPAPKHTHVVHTDTEFRIELPFGPEPSSLFYVGINHAQNWSTSTHYHDHYELCYLDGGDCPYKIDETLYDVHAGELLVTKPGELHFGLAGEQSPFKLYYVGFALTGMPELQAEFYRVGLHRVAKDSGGQVKSLFDRIIGEVQEPHYLGRAMAEGLFRQLLVQTLRLLRDSVLTGEAQPKPLQPAITDVINRLHRDIRYDHDLDELARSIPISRSHLAREFKSAVGVPIGKYIRNLCMDKAKSELRGTAKPVTQIADELGFSSIHTFSIFFKRFADRSPSDYRHAGRDG
ncbi:helix-turn-helix transcriptional regulator [Paenibacillus arenilitoris]|uniref:AraC family transcriptional regulator n=1 Tax=Paenibacillus arenilitoris TaxID=2772299 RepID=A0A927CLK4_9BACL|nr:AraC family transcriptional regulator [Paenibacillus arenilitoris]MBD2867865.1 AraC family transcriptional regulator [Paenibacillus arenilitoris]